MNDGRGKEETRGKRDIMERHVEGFNFPGGRGAVEKGATLPPNICNVFF